jgi:glycine dehydrogenase subunit 1
MFIPHTDIEREEMLKVIGVKSLDDLFADVPAKHRFPDLQLPPSLTEMEARSLLEEFAGANESTAELVCFLGAGAYRHYIPAAVDAIIRRGEFYSAYTPYQPEISQGTLQAIFEFQSIVANLTGMDVSNASHYDGATATAEAAVLAYSNFRGTRTRFVLSPSVNPQYRATLRTYLQGYKDLQIVGDLGEVPTSAAPDELLKLVDTNTALVIVQYPDFLGRIHDWTTFAKAVHEKGALLCIVFNPIALGVLKTPGAMDADIAVGDGQPLGIPLSFGGPYLGLFATKKEFVRKLSGRLVGETVDGQGRRGYVLTLTAREQHIRREKATSNICTNQGLMALAATAYVSLLGKHGIKQVSELCYHKAHYAASKIAEIPGYSLPFKTPFYHEFVVKCPIPVEEINLHLLDHGILGGYDLGKDYPELEGHMLIAVTEMVTRDDIDALCEVLQEVAS